MRSQERLEWQMISDAASVVVLGRFRYLLLCRDEFDKKATSRTRMLFSFRSPSIKVFFILQREDEEDRDQK